MKRGRKLGSRLRVWIKNRHKKACPSGHPYAGDNLRIKRVMAFRKLTQTWVMTEHRACAMCQRLCQRLLSRRRRRDGRMLSYPAWAATKGL